MGILSRDAIRAIENGEEVFTYKIKLLQEDGFVCMGFDKAAIWVTILDSVRQCEPELYEVLMEAFKQFGEDEDSERD